MQGIIGKEMDQKFMRRAKSSPSADEKPVFAALKERAKSGAMRRLGNIGGAEKDRLAHELGMIGKTDTAKLFLYWADAVSAIRQKTYPYICGVQNCSLVSYCLGITEVNPVKTGSCFERLLNGQSARVPVLFVEIPKGRRGEIQVRPEANAFVCIEEKAARTDLPAGAADAFFAEQTYGEKEIFRRAAASFGRVGQRDPPETLGEFTDWLVCKRCAEFTDEMPSLLYQEDAVGLFCKAGFSCEEAECARRALVKKNKTETDFYRDLFCRAAEAAGRSVEEADGIFSALKREILFTVCRASYTAMAQYLYMEAYFKEKKVDKLCFLKN